MEITQETVGWYFLYATVWRTTIVIAGIVIIYLGYRLYAREPTQKANSTGNGVAADEARLQMGKATVLLKQAAPGTFFVVLGIALLLITVMNSSPELTLKAIVNSNKAIGKSLPPSKDPIKEINDYQLLTITVRGDEEYKYQRLRKAHETLMKTGKIAQKINSCTTLLSSADIQSKEIANVLYELSGIYNIENDFHAAFILARIALSLDCESMVIKKNIVKIYYSSGLYEKGIQYAKEIYEQKKNKDAAFLVARGYELIGNRNEADNWLKKQ